MKKTCILILAAFLFISNFIVSAEQTYNFSDSFADTSKLYSYDAYWLAGTLTKTDDNVTVPVLKGGGTTLTTGQTASFIYKMPENIRAFQVHSLRQQKGDNNIANNVKYYVSPDGAGYTAISDGDITITTAAYNDTFRYETHTCGNVPAGCKYLKIETTRVYSINDNRFFSVSIKSGDPKFDKVTVNVPDEIVPWYHAAIPYTCYYDDGSEITGIAPVLKFESLNTDIAAIDETTGVLTVMKSGEVTVKLTATIGDISKEATKTINILSLDSVEISAPKEYVDIGGTLATSATAKITNGETINLNLATVTYQCSDNTLAMVDNSGVIMGIKAGDIEITVTVSYCGVTKSDTIRLGVGSVPKYGLISASLATSSDSLIQGDIVVAVVSAVAENGKNADLFTANIEFVNSDPSVIEVSKNGEIKGVSEGSAALYANVTKNGTTVSTDTINITVLKEEIEKVEVMLNTDKLVDSTTSQATVKGVTTYGNYVALEDASIKYSSTNTNVATVDATGKIAVVWKGTTDIGAMVLYKGITYTALPKSLTVSKVAGGTFTDTIENKNKMFFCDPGYNIVKSEGRNHYELVRIANATGVNYYVTYELGNNISKFIVQTDQLNAFADQDTFFYVSQDNVNYTEIPYGDIKSTVGAQAATGGQWFLRSYECENIPQNSRYLRLKIAHPDLKKFQFSRLYRVDVEFGGAPKINSIAFRDKNMEILDNNFDLSGAVDAVIGFDQPIMQDSLSNILIKDDAGSATTVTGAYDSGSYTYTVNLPSMLKNKNYTLEVSGVKSMAGYTLEETQSVSIVSGMPKRYISGAAFTDENGAAVQSLNGLSKVTANVTVSNSDESCTNAVVLLIQYDKDNKIKNISFKNISIGTGLSTLSTKLDLLNLQSGDFVKAFVMDDFTTMRLFDNSKNNCLKITAGS